jgi:hypothetical protein
MADEFTSEELSDFVSSLGYPSHMSPSRLWIPSSSNSSSTRRSLPVSSTLKGKSASMSVSSVNSLVRILPIFTLSGYVVSALARLLRYERLDAWITDSVDSPIVHDAVIKTGATFPLTGSCFDFQLFLQKVRTIEPSL